MGFDYILSWDFATIYSYITIIGDLSDALDARGEPVVIDEIGPDGEVTSYMMTVDIENRQYPYKTKAPSEFTLAEGQEPLDEIDTAKADEGFDYFFGDKAGANAFGAMDTFFSRFAIDIATTHANDNHPPKTHQLVLKVY